MFNPILGIEMECEPCDAHIIPAALGKSHTTVVSERKFDNCFGATFDQKLVRHVRNTVGDWKDVVVDFVDEGRSVNKTPIRTKWKEGAQREEVTVNLDLSEHLKRHVGLSAGSTLRVTPHFPDRNECAEIGMSMMHSAFLTLYFHFGKDYVSQSSIAPLRQSLSASLERGAAHRAFDFFRLAQRLTEAYKPSKSLFAASFKLSGHPIWKLTFARESCFATILPYDPDYNVVCLMPGYGERAYYEWESIMARYNRKWSAEQHSIEPFDRDKHGDGLTLWHST